MQTGDEHPERAGRRAARRVQTRSARGRAVSGEADRHEAAPEVPWRGRSCTRGTGARTARVDEEIGSGRFRTRARAWPGRDPCLMSLNALIPLPSTPRRETPDVDAVRMRVNRVGVTLMTRARASDNEELSLTSQLAAGLNNGGVS